MPKEVKYIPKTMVLHPDQITGFIYERKITTEKEKKAFREMVESVKRHGVIEDIVVREVKGKKDKYEGIAGWMRFQAVKEAKLPEFTAKVYPADMPDSEMWMVGVTENVIGIDANPLDVARMLFKLKKETGWRNKKIAEALGKGEAWVSLTLKLQSSEQIGEAVKSGYISKSQAEEVGRVSDATVRDEILIKAKGATVVETKKIVEEALGKEKKEARIEELEDLIVTEKEKIKAEEERRLEKIALGKEIFVKESELIAAKTTTPENILDMLESKKEIDEGYFASIEQMNEAQVKITELEEELTEIDMKKIEKEKTELDRRNAQNKGKIESLQKELFDLRAASKEIATKTGDLVGQVRKRDEIASELSYARKVYKRAEEKKISTGRKRKGDIEDYELLKKALDRGEKEHAEKIHIFENELAELRAEHKRFGGMQLEKRKERLKKMEEELKGLRSAAG